MYIYAYITYEAGGGGRDNIFFFFFFSANPLKKKKKKKTPALYHTKSEVEGGIILAVVTKLCLSRQKMCFVGTLCLLCTCYVTIAHA